LWYNRGMKRVLKYALILLISGSVLWAGKILVDEKNWVAISALATLVLAFGAFWAIMDNRHARIVDRKERLLNEIIEWAENVVDHVLESGVFDIATLRQGMDRDDTFQELFYELTNLRLDKVKSMKILKTHDPIDGDLYNSAETLANNLEVQISHLTECRRDPKSSSMGTIGENIEKLKNAATYNENIIGLATAVIEKAAKIKTKDIS